MTDTRPATPPSSPGWVFLSYANPDKDRVRNIVTFLQERQIDVWWDDLQVPGDDWSWVLRQKLDNAACVVVAWSHESVQNRFVEAEVRTVLDVARHSGRLIPVLLDADVGKDIPLPFTMFQHVDLSGWDGQSAQPMAALVDAVRGLVGRPPRSDERRGSDLGNEYAVLPALQATAELRRLTEVVGSVGEVLTGDVGAAGHLRAALNEVHKTVDVVAGAVEEFIEAGLAPGDLQPGPYLRLERGGLVRRIGDGRGHCDLIAVHYGKPDGVRAWLRAHASSQVLSRADQAFAALASADGDLFMELGRIGDVLTIESRIVVNLLTAGQPAEARRRVIDGRARLAPLEAELQASAETLQRVEHVVGYARIS